MYINNWTLLQWWIQDFLEVGVQIPGGGLQHRILSIFFQKLHEIERIWTLRRVPVPRAPLIRQCIDKNVKNCLDVVVQKKAS